MRTVCCAMLGAALLGGCGQGSGSAEAASADDYASAEAVLAEVAVDPWAEQRAREQARITAENGCVEQVIQKDFATEAYGEDPGRVTAMRAIVLTDCPAEFQVAYVKHIQAWEKYYRIKQGLRDLDTGDNLGGAALVDFVGGVLGFSPGAIGDHIDAIKLLERERNAASQEVSDTYEIVTTLARSRGVAIPTNG